jgi:nickel-type superoxide dismutase maturation protease
MALVTAAATAAIRVRRVAVHGSSMLPTLVPGDRLVVMGLWRVHAGDVVAVADPRNPSRLLVKRVAAVDRRAGMVTVVGDNQSASTDSRTFGPVPRRSLVGRVVYRYGPPERQGWVPHL